MTVEQFLIDENMVVYRRNGKIIKEKFTDEQMERFVKFIKTIK